MRRLEVQDVDLYPPQTRSPFQFSYSMAEANETKACGSLGRARGGSALLQRQHCAMSRRRLRYEPVSEVRKRGGSKGPDNHDAIVNDVLAALGSATQSSSARKTSTTVPVKRTTRSTAQRGTTITATPTSTSTRLTAPTVRNSSDQARISSVRASRVAIASRSVAAASALASEVSVVGAGVASVQRSIAQASAAAAGPSTISLRQSVAGVLSSAASIVSSRRAAATTPTATSTLLSSSTLPSSLLSSSISTSSASSQTSTSSSSPHSTSTSTSTPANTPSQSHPFQKKYIAAIVVPIIFAALLAFLVFFFCCRRRKSTPVPSAPLKPRTPAGGIYGSTSITPTRVNRSQMTGAATPESAIGVAIGGNESRVAPKWKRRSFLDVLTSLGGSGGARSRTARPAGGRISVGSSFGGRERSTYTGSEVGSEDRGVGGYNSNSARERDRDRDRESGSGSIAGAHRHESSASVSGYQPGMPRPVLTGYMYDQFGSNSQPQMSSTATGSVSRPIVAPSAVPLPRRTTRRSSSSWSTATGSTEPLSDDQHARISTVTAERRGEMVHPRPYGSYRYQSGRAGFISPSRGMVHMNPADPASNSEDQFYTDDGSRSRSGMPSSASGSGSGGGVSQSQSHNSGSGSGSSGSRGRGSSSSGFSGSRTSSSRGALATQAAGFGRETLPTGQGVSRLNDGSWW